MKKSLFSKAMAGVLTGAVVIGTMTGCSGQGAGSTAAPASGASAPAAESKVIKVGAIDPTTGDNANGGLDDLQGKQLAVKDCNEAGGITIDGETYTVELVYYDDASSASQSVSVCTKLITEDNVVGIVGSFSSSCTLADLDVITEYSIPMITSGSSAASVLTSGCDWISRSFPGDKLQISALINYILSTAPETKKIGVIYSNDDYGKGGFNSITEAAAAKNLEIVGESFATDDTDMTAQLSSLKSQNVDALFIWCNYTPGSYCMKQARALDWDVQFYSGTGTIHEDTFKLSDGTYVGTINSVPFTTSTTDDSAKAWIEHYKNEYNEDPSQNAARGYDGMGILLEAIKTAGSTDGTAIQEAIRSTADYQGIQGSISIDKETGEYQGDVMIVQANDKGAWTYLDSASTN